MHTCIFSLSRSLLPVSSLSLYLSPFPILSFPQNSILTIPYTSKVYPFLSLIHHFHLPRRQNLWTPCRGTVGCGCPTWSRSSRRWRPQCRRMASAGSNHVWSVRSYGASGEPPPRWPLCSGCRQPWGRHAWSGCPSCRALTWGGGGGSLQSSAGEWERERVRVSAFSNT